MQIYALVPILLLGVFHSLCEAAPENMALASSNHESKQQNAAAPSRVKRGNYDMLRLTRGLNMLRLGKRGSEIGGLSSAGYPEYQDLSRDDILALEKISQDLQSPYLSEISPEDYYGALSSFQNSYGHSRYRRSTPSDNTMVTPAPSIDVNAEDGADNTLIQDTDGEAYLLYPDFPGDSVLVDDDGKVWDGKIGEGLEKRRYTNSFNSLRLGKRQQESLNTEFTGNQAKRFNILRLGKRSLNMIRLGKREPGMEDEDRSDLNKRNLNMLRLGKRQLKMLRLGKRQLPMLRVGKRMLNILRAGNRDGYISGEAFKRNLNMLRLGKRRDNDAEKKNLNMLRLGKRSVDSQQPMIKDE